MPNIKATKVLQKRSDAAVEAFHKSYSKIWGDERWTNTLFPALSQPTRYCALVNQFGECNNEAEFFAAVDTNSKSETTFLSHLLHTDGQISIPKVIVKQSTEGFPRPRSSNSVEAQHKVLSHWNMDFASVVAASMLGVTPGDRVLDLCAAPGGKSIVLAQMLWPDLYAQKANEDAGSTPTSNQSVLQSNEYDHIRQKRLLANLQSYIPSELFSEGRVKVLRLDGSLKSACQDFPYGTGGYDKVLLDAPCSSERHILQAHAKAVTSGQISEEMANWKSSHSKTLAKTQTALLLTALKAVKIGGSVLYATCSIADEENDQTIERTLEALKRERKKSAESAEISWKVHFDTRLEEEATLQAAFDTLSEKTKYGRIILPDHLAGGKWGPLYFCLLRKVANKHGVSASLGIV